MQNTAQRSGAVAPQPKHDSPLALEINNLCFAHSKGEEVLHNVSLCVSQGSFWALVGPNGGGKTTLLRLILGLLRPSAGTLRVFGASPGDKKLRVGYVPQFSTLQTDFPANVLDMVLMGGARTSPWGGFWPRDGAAVERAMRYLSVLGLEECVQRRVGELSGGQRQRALVARALMSRTETHDAEPFLLLLDEPTASVDPQGKFCFYEFLGKLRGEITIIVVSHDLFIASPFFDSVAFVNKEVTPLHGDALSPDNLTLLFGQHLHNCPVADIQHTHGIHHDNCTHPACRDPGAAGVHGGPVQAKVGQSAENAQAKAGG